MNELRAHGGIFKHGGPHEPFATDNSVAYNDGVLGQVNPVVEGCRQRCAAKGTPSTACVSRCIKRGPLLGLGQEGTVDPKLSNQIRILTVVTGLTGVLVAGLLVQQLVTAKVPT